ncbi:hypothetical protein SY83_19445 [Paenibacillus swuensis]|uniref:Uncharacterized protein n=1 Tax=Paenibacillus swuensis TaxID=1178515 RepID=A0A172TM39_9BACL|nr:hypothetical protein [Paenibacillus swuensis]ANE48100.1 hypothetical protein SY83_19445 [Paenibacillus swuensis]
MQKIKHRVKCFDSEILVVHKNEAYELSIQSLLNPLGFGSALETFLDEDDAVSAAQYFCHMYTIAKEKGYYLQNNSFTKPDKESYAANWVIEKKFSEDEWSTILAG